MQINKKKIAIIISIIVILIILIILFIYINNKSENKNITKDYYFTYVDDDNMLSNSVKIYKTSGEIVEGYTVYLNDEPIGYTDSTSCVITTTTLDLSKTNEITFSLNTNQDIKYVAYAK